MSGVSSGLDGAVHDGAVQWYRARPRRVRALQAWAQVASRIAILRPPGSCHRPTGAIIAYLSKWTEALSVPVRDRGGNGNPRERWGVPFPIRSRPPARSHVQAASPLAGRRPAGRRPDLHRRLGPQRPPLRSRVPGRGGRRRPGGRPRRPRPGRRHPPARRHRPEHPAHRPPRRGPGHDRPPAAQDGGELHLAARARGPGGRTAGDPQGRQRRLHAAQLHLQGGQGGQEPAGRRHHHHQADRPHQAGRVPLLLQVPPPDDGGRRHRAVTDPRRSRPLRRRMMQARETEPNGGIVAATIAAGAGCAALGIITVASAASSEFADLLTLYAPSGPLTGKATVSSIIYLIVWINLHFRLRDRELSLSRGFLLTMFLLTIGLVGTFPPVYQLFQRAG